MSAFIALLILPAFQLQVTTPCNGKAARKTDNGGKRIGTFILHSRSFPFSGPALRKTLEQFHPFI